MKKLLLALSFALAVSASGAALAVDRPYNAKADAKADIQVALQAAASARQPVLLIFGANWCEDCVALDHALKSGRNAALVAQGFKVVKIDVGNFDHNLDIAQAYGDPIKRGIPAAVIVSADNRVLFATRGGELANARQMSDDGVYQLFSNALNTAQTKP